MYGVYSVFVFVVMFMVSSVLPVVYQFDKFKIVKPDFLASSCECIANFFRE